jgi:hypothetical protein
MTPRNAFILLFGFLVFVALLSFPMRITGAATASTGTAVLMSPMSFGILAVALFLAYKKVKV